MNTAGYHIVIGNATDVGKIRTRNEDYMAHFDTPWGYCIIVCDGMGGHAAGQVASQNAVGAIQQYLQDNKNENDKITMALKNAIEFANFQLREMMNVDPALKGMGTTCVMAIIKEGQLYIAHAGDSRLYLVRNGNAEQVTKDHSSVQRLIDLGIITEEEAELSDKKNEISKAIGVFEIVDPAITEIPVALHKNDKLLLCTDGLTAHVNRGKILEIISSEIDVQHAALKLTELANSGGGSDNITVQVVHYTGKTIHNKKKNVNLKRIALIFLLFAVFAFGFIGYKKLGSRGDDKPGLKDKTNPAKKDMLNTGTIRTKTDTLKTERKAKPEIPDYKNSDAPEYDSVREKRYLKSPDKKRN